MTYYLDKAEWPTIPVPHDCVIHSISISDEFLVLDFEQEISVHDSVQRICPDAKSLTIKIHLLDTFEIYQLKTRKFPTIKRMYEEIGFEKLVGLVKRNRVEYLYHYVAYQALIISCSINIILDLRADYVEFLWNM